jgi:P2-related tail formation protein
VAGALVSRVGALIPALRPFEAAAAAGLSDALPVEVVAESLDPARAPARFLPWIAASRGVSLWFEHWSLDAKRALTVEWPSISARLGTRWAAERLLSYVDADLVHALAYPARFAIGRSFIGRTPLAHPPHLARYLVRVRTYAPPRPLVVGRAAFSGAVIRRADERPFRRALSALRASKAPETEIRVDFAHRRPVTVADAPRLDEGLTIDAWRDRFKL